MQHSRQQTKLVNKLISLGIQYIEEDDQTLMLIAIPITGGGDCLAIGMDSNPRPGIKDTAVIIGFGDIQQADSQYVIDNLETIYNTLTL